MRSRLTISVRSHLKSAFPFQVVDLLNQAALISADEKLTVLKQVCSCFKAITYCSKLMEQLDWSMLKKWKEVHRCCCPGWMRYMCGLKFIISRSRS